ncbi:MAG: uridine kinase [Thiolinea sp.]
MMQNAIRRPKIIGISGGSGGGKTLLATMLCQQLGADNTVLLSLDAFYKNQVDIPLAIRGNYDHPDSIDQELFFDQLRQLRLGEDVDIPCYDFPTHSRISITEYIACKPVIILDGVLLYALEGIFDYLDLSIFVDTAPDVRLARRLLRDVQERGRTLECVVEQYLTTVRPMHNRYVEPHKQRVDKIVSGEIDFEETLPDLLKTIERLTEEQRQAA